MYSLNTRVQKPPVMAMTSGLAMREAGRSAGAWDAEQRPPKTLMICHDETRTWATPPAPAGAGAQSRKAKRVTIG